MDVPHNPDHFLREWRERRDWSQEKLGKKVGVAHNTIGRWETGEAGIKPKHLRRLAETFEVPRFAILDVDPSSAEGSAMADLLEVFESIDPGQWANAVAQLRAFAQSFPVKKAATGRP